MRVPSNINRLINPSHIHDLTKKNPWGYNTDCQRVTTLVWRPWVDIPSTHRYINSTWSAMSRCSTRVSLSWETCSLSYRHMMPRSVDVYIWLCSFVRIYVKHMIKIWWLLWQYSIVSKAELSRCGFRYCLYFLQVVKFVTNWMQTALALRFTSSSTLARGTSRL